MLHEELELLKKQNQRIKKELVFMQFYIFSFWEEKYRNKIQRLKSIKPELFECKSQDKSSMQSVFKRVKAVGHVIDVGEDKQKFFLGVDEQLYQDKDMEATMEVLKISGKKNDVDEIIVWGKGLTHGIAHIKTDTTETLQVGDKVVYLFEVDIRVTHNCI